MWQVLKEGELKAEVIDAKKLIDQHYYAIASKASRASQRIGAAPGLTHTCHDSCHGPHECI